VSWAPTTTRQTRFVLDRYLRPHLGGQRVGDVTPALINAAYATPRARGGVDGNPLGAGNPWDDRSPLAGHGAESPLVST